jgi:hypothetical protein
MLSTYDAVVTTVVPFDVLFATVPKSQLPPCIIRAAKLSVADRPVAFV